MDKILVQIHTYNLAAKGKYELLRGWQIRCMSIYKDFRILKMIENDFKQEKTVDLPACFVFWMLLGLPPHLDENQELGTSRNC